MVFCNRFFSRPYSAALSFPPRGVTGTSCYCFEYNLHLIKIPSHLNRESIYRELGPNTWLTYVRTGPPPKKIAVRRGHGRATTCELYAKIIAESELLQLDLNEIHKFCFQHWSRGRGTCGTGSGAPGMYALFPPGFK